MFGLYKQAAELLLPEAEPLLLERLSAAAREAPLPAPLAAAAAAPAEAAAAGVTWETADDPEGLRGLAATQLQRELGIVFRK